MYLQKCNFPLFLLKKVSRDHYDADMYIMVLMSQIIKVNDSQITPLNFEKIHL